MIQEMTVEEGKIVLRFDEPIREVDDGSSIVGFAVAGKDGRFQPAAATHLVKGKRQSRSSAKRQSSPGVEQSFGRQPGALSVRLGTKPAR